MMMETLQKKQLIDTIATRACSPLERLQKISEGENDIGEQGGEAQLQRLYKVVNAIDEEQQARFLAHFRLNEQQMRQSLVLSNSAQEKREVSWPILLAQILSEYTQNLSVEDTTRDRCRQEAAPVPFEELLLPFIHYAREQLLLLVPDQASLVDEAVQIALERWLLNWLLSISGQALAFEFMCFRAASEESSVAFEQQSEQRVLYDEFLHYYAGEDFLSFFAEYSLLARVLINSIEQWIEVCAEFLERLKVDRNQIAHFFFDGEQIGTVIEINAECADRHHYGRTVFLLTFADGRRLVYKPRCMDIDEAFFKCVAWLNEENLSPDLRCPRVLNRNAYGWMEYIEHRPCRTAVEVQSYYQRCGLLLCLFYVLGSTDMHYENLVAHGAYPVPIDLETIICPSFSDLSSSRATEEKPADRNVLCSGMLNTRLTIEGQSVNIAALGDLQAFDALLPDPVWRNINTDAMTLSYEMNSISTPDEHKVVYDGVVVKVSDHVEELVTGFRHMYHFLMEYRDKFLVRNKMLNLFADCPIRYVYRATSIYRKQLLRLTSFEMLQDGTDRWIDLQVFKKPLLKRQVDPRLWTIASAELAALERLDVPWFGTSTSSTDMYTDEGIIIEKMFTHSALEQIQSCLALLCNEDMERQIRFIYMVVESASE